MIWRTFVLTLRLMADRRMSVVSKMVPILAVAYYLSPLDLIPDVFGSLGVIDDVAFLAGCLHFFIRLAPDAVLHEHLEKLSRYDKVLRMVRDMPPPVSKKIKTAQQEVIEGKYTR
jgi:uncharacterized membrane protein YkvA (DUF1232 family)